MFVSDKGPFYNTSELKQAVEEVEVQYIISTPHQPQSNGLAEKYIQVVKSLLQKAKETGNNQHFPMMLYRNTPFPVSLQLSMDLVYRRQDRSDVTVSHIALMKGGQAAFI